MSTMTTRRKPTVRLWTIPGYGYLIGALTVLEDATAEQLCAYLRERETPYEGDTGWTVQGVARMLSWMQRQGYPVVRSPLTVARAYARQTGRPAPRAGYWRVTEARTRAMRDAVAECLLAAVTDARERRPSV